MSLWQGVHFIVYDSDVYRCKINFNYGKTNCGIRIKTILPGLPLCVSGEQAQLLCWRETNWGEHACNDNTASLSGLGNYRAIFSLTLQNRLLDTMYQYLTNVCDNDISFKVILDYGRTFHSLGHRLWSCMLTCVYVVQIRCKWFMFYREDNTKIIILLSSRPRMSTTFMFNLTRLFEHAFPKLCKSLLLKWTLK